MGNLAVRSLRCSVALRLLLDLEYDRMVLAGRADLTGTARRAEFIEEFSVVALESLPLTWDIILVIDRLDRADWFASPAVHTFIGLDVEHPSALIDAIHWAFLDARFILHIDTWLGDYICHRKRFLSAQGLRFSQGSVRHSRITFPS